MFEFYSFGVLGIQSLDVAYELTLNLRGGTTSGGTDRREICQELDNICSATTDKQ